MAFELALDGEGGVARRSVPKSGGSCSTMRSDGLFVHKFLWNSKNGAVCKCVLKGREAA